MNPALTLDPDTDDLALDGGRLALARPETTVATSSAKIISSCSS